MRFNFTFVLNIYRPEANVHKVYTIPMTLDLFFWTKCEIILPKKERLFTSVGRFS